MLAYRARTGSAESRRARLIVRAVASSALTLFAGWATAAQAQIVPTGATPVSGGVSVGAPSANANGGLDLTVTQSGGRGVVNWNSFSVGAQDRLTFNQPDANAATLNRVTGGIVSTIAGQVSATGSVYLVNPNGIAITSSGQVQTGGGFVASTLDISDADFNAGTNRFSGSGASTNVANAGSINASGFVALLGGTVSQSGTITMPVGKVALASGEAVTFDVNGGNFLQVTAPTNAVTANGAALIQAGGTITVQQTPDSNTAIQISAATATNAVRNAINLTGTLSATSATVNGSRIILDGGFAGAVAVSGSVSARQTTSGGALTITGDQIDLSGATVNVTSTNMAAAGGVVGVTGSSVTANGTLSSLLYSSSVQLNATRTGSGDGSVRITAPLVTSGYGELILFARNDIALSGVTAGNVRLSMNAGNNNPYTGNVSTSGAIEVRLFNLTNGLWRQVGAAPTFRTSDFRFTQANARFLRATGGDGSVATPYVLTDVYGLQGVASSDTLGSAFRLGGTIDATVTLTWNSGTGFVPIGRDFDFTGSLSGANGAAGGARYAIDGLTINAAVAGGLFRGLSGRVSDLNLTNVSITTPGTGGGALAETLRAAGTVANADVSGTRSGGLYTGGMLGSSFGTLTDVRSAVTVSGGTNNAIGGLVGGMFGGSITRGTATGAVGGLDFVGGLVGLVSGGTIANSSAAGAVDGRTSLGGLLGYLSGGASVSGSSASGNVTGSTTASINVGGLIGELRQAASGIASVTNSSASGIVNGAFNVGGLIGGAFATTDGSVAITGASATGRVIANLSTSANSIGGLIGRVETSNTVGGRTVKVTSSFATGNVSTTSTATNSYVGGLIGNMTKSAGTDFTVVTIRDSYATGNVTSGGGAIGGLVGSTGNFDTTIADSYASGVVQGASAVGGFIGQITNTAATITDARTSGPATASGAVTGSGNNVGGLVGNMATGSVTGARATGAVQGNANVGGLIGSINNTQATAVTIARSSATGNVTGNSTSIGGLVGLNTKIGGGAFTSIEDSFATGAVRGVSIVGGLVGQQVAQSGALNQILRSYATGSVTATTATTTGTASAGGLVGLATIPTTLDGTVLQILGSYATGTVAADNTTSNVSRVGGLVGGATMPTTGNVWLQLNDVYATGAVRSGGGQVGGLVGSMVGTAMGMGLGNAYATGTVSGVSNVGGLIGSLNNASVYAVHATGAVTARGSNVGGLVGGFFNGAEVAYAYATGAVSSTATGDVGIGGLIGVLGNSTGRANIVRESYATSAVSVSGGLVGGLIGVVTNGTISNVYATGTTSGTDSVGGLVGSLASGTSVSGAWASGAVTANDATRAGGLVGLLGGTLGNAYWDNYSTGLGVSVGSASTATPAATVASVTSDPNAPGGTTAYSAASYANLPGVMGMGDTEVAGFVFLPGGTRPFLGFEVPIDGNPGVATDGDDAIRLVNMHQLQLVNYDGETRSSGYVLGGSIDLAETGRVAAGTPGSYSGMWAGSGWVPLGTDGAGKVASGAGFVTYDYRDAVAGTAMAGFSGGLNGGGFTLSNLTIKRAGVQNVGLFGASSGIVGNLTLTGNVTGYIGAGGLVGLQQGGLIIGVTSAVNVTGNANGATVQSAFVGGLAGFASGATIVASSASGTVGAAGAAGGLIGYLYNSTLTNSSASGVVNGRVGKTGGLVGIIDRSTVTGGSSTGSVNGVAGGPAYGVLRDGGTYNGVGEPNPN